jgi:hypothetical protein
MRDEDMAAAVVLTMKSAIAPILERLTAIESLASRSSAEAELLLAREITPLRERLAALESRPPAQGPPGAAGADGAPGPKGDPGMRYRGVYADGTAYVLGDVVTWAGGAWHCNTATTDKPGDGSDVWTLMVKRGRDARGAR